MNDVYQSHNLASLESNKKYDCYGKIRLYLI